MRTIIFILANFYFLSANAQDIKFTALSTKPGSSTVDTITLLKVAQAYAATLKQKDTTLLGIALSFANKTFACYSSGDYGLAVYQKNENMLQGKWINSISGGLQGSETIYNTDLRNLAGSYNISGVNTDGNETYSGTLNIEKKGQIYLCTYFTGESSYQGLGMIHGNLFAVAWSLTPHYILQEYNLYPSGGDARSLSSTDQQINYQILQR